MTESEYNLVCNLARLRIVADALRWVHGDADLNAKVKTISGEVSALIDTLEQRVDQLEIVEDE